jgi:hypothetical protein
MLLLWWFVGRKSYPIKSIYRNRVLTIHCCFCSVLTNTTETANHEQNLQFTTLSLRWKQIKNCGLRCIAIFWKHVTHNNL